MTTSNVEGLPTFNPVHHGKPKLKPTLPFIANYALCLKERMQSIGLGPWFHYNEQVPNENHDVMKSSAKRACALVGGWGWGGFKCTEVCEKTERSMSPQWNMKSDTNIHPRDFNMGPEHPRQWKHAHFSRMPLRLGVRQCFLQSGGLVLLVF